MLWGVLTPCFISSGLFRRVVPTDERLRASVHTHTHRVDRHDLRASASSLHSPPLSKKCFLLLHLFLHLSGVAALFSFFLLLTDIAQGQTKKDGWPKNKPLLTPKKHWRSLSSGAAYANVTRAATACRDFNGCYVTWWSQGWCCDSCSRGWRWINNGRTEGMWPVKTKCYHRRTGEPVPFRYGLPLGVRCQDDAADCLGWKEGWWLSPKRTDWYAKKKKHKYIYI